MQLVNKLVEEEHHLADIARDGYAPATMPIVIAAIMLALTGVVALILGISLAAYYLG